MRLVRPLFFCFALLPAAPCAFGADSGLDDFLPVEKAFQLQVRPIADGTGLTADFTPAPTYYLYRDRLSFVRIDAGKTVPLAPVLPRGEKKRDPNFGDVEVFHQTFQVALPLAGTPAPAADTTITISYQGCSEKGLCYPPVERAYRIGKGATAAVWTAVEVPPSEASTALPAVAALSTPSSTVIAPLTTANGPSAKRHDPADTVAPDSENSRIANLLGSGNALVIIAAFFGFGLLLALTPCMFPMIPILSGIIVGDGKMATRRRGLALSSAYVLGMAITYAIAGVGAGLSGALLQNALQNVWVLGAFALIFVALACGMFGLFQIQLPGFLQTRLSSASNTLSGGRITGVFMMGALSALIVGPCVAAPLAGALLYISQTRNVVLGGLALFSMAIGMGVPLLLIGASAGALLPRAGPWMDSVKRLFGVLLLATAIWLISPVVDPAPVMLMSAALLIGSAVFLHALDPLPATSRGMSRVGKSVGILLLISGTALVIGVLSGSRNMLQPLERFTIGATPSGTASPASHALFTRVGSVSELDQKILAAAGKPIMLDFYADWCVSCKEMERFTFSDPEVRALMDTMVVLQADVTANNPQDKALLKRFGIFGPPGIVFFDRNGKELYANRVIGYQRTVQFLKSLRAAAV